MYPDSNQNQPQQQPPAPQPEQSPTQYSIDYLNQIAPKAPKKPLNNRILILAAGGGILLILIVGILSLLGGGSTPTTNMETLSARLTTLTKITTDSQKNIKSNQLNGINSNLNIFLTNADHDIITPLKNNGIDPANIDKTITAAENGSALTAKLDDARLNAVFDRTYAHEMSYQLATVHALMQSIYNATKSGSMKSFLQTSDTNLSTIKKQLDDFYATSS